MHTIDLLKGQGIPPKTTFRSVFFTALVFVLPLIAGSIMVGMYAVNKINLEMRMIEVEKLTKKLEDNMSGKQEAAKFQKEQNYYAARIDEASKCIDTYFQWSPVLIALAKNMPEDMVMDNLSVSNVNTAVLKKTDDPNAGLVIPIPKKKMTIDLSGSGKDYTAKVQEYKEKLESEQSLKHLMDVPTYVKLANQQDSSEESFRMNLVFDKKK